jgi:6-phosphogluconolactonase
VADNLFPPLAALSLEWPLVHFFWVDERAVEPSDPESNYGAARRLLLDSLKIDPARVHRMPADQPDLDAAAREYADILRGILGAPLRLDYVLLGMGPDGHVASLFPGHALLVEERRTVAAVTDAPKPPPRRLTLTLPVLTQAERVVVVAYGASKAAPIQEAVERADSALPVALVLRRAKHSLVLMDEEAASLLHRP